MVIEDWQLSREFGRARIFYCRRKNKVLFYRYVYGDGSLKKYIDDLKGAYMMGGEL